jgi:mannosidase alpha-like ER degradation enhancer 2
MNTGQRKATTYGALDAFFSRGVSDVGRFEKAKALQESSFAMWKRMGIEPEEINYQTLKDVSPGYPLRPEIIESTYYLHHYAQVARRKAAAASYRQQGQRMFQDFVKYCRTEEGYAALKSVVTKEKSDSMQSFLFAETFKYFYLLFASPGTLDFDKIVFNTEAHPIIKNWQPKKFDKLQSDPKTEWVGKVYPADLIKKTTLM